MCLSSGLSRFVIGLFCDLYALQDLKGSSGGILFGLLAGSAFRLRQVLALDAHPAVEAFGVAVLAAAFFSGIAG